MKIKSKLQIYQYMTTCYNYKKIKKIQTKLETAKAGYQSQK